MSSDASQPDTLGTSRSPLQINPAVVVGLGGFGGAALRRVVDRLRLSHPVLLDEMGWLWLTTAGWRPVGSSDPSPDPLGECAALVTIAHEPLLQAFDRATSQASVAALNDAGYDIGTTLDLIIVARADDPFARGALWPLLDLIHLQAPLRDNRVTLILACDSRRFAGPSAPSLAQFFGALAELLVADRANPAPGAIAWCYLCDALDADGQLLENGDQVKDVVTAQVELVAGFVALLVGSGLRRDLAYSRTAIPQLAHDTNAPPDAALVSSFGWGAYVLPIDQIVALARDRVALRLHGVAFPSKTAVADREAAANARERWMGTTDLSPQGLRERLLGSPDGASIRFNTTPPDLLGFEPEATLRGLGRWRTGLESQWTDKGTSPPAQIERNADELLGELTAGIQREVTAMIGDRVRGPYQAPAFLEGLPQLIEEARVHTMDDDRYYRKMAVPSLDEKLREFETLTGEAGGRGWRVLIVLNLVFAIAFAFALWKKPHFWPYVLSLWLGGLVGLQIARSWLYRRRLAKCQSDFVAAVQFKFQALEEQEMRVKRRGLFDALLLVVREERGGLLAWRRAVAAAKGMLTRTDVSPPQTTGEERLLCEPADFPSPVDDYDEEDIADFAARCLDPATRPRPRESDAEAIAAWLRSGAESVLAGWQRTVNIVDWHAWEPRDVVKELAATVQLQWPLAPGEGRQVGLDVIGFPERDMMVPHEPTVSDRVLVVSTRDPARLSYAPTRHGLRLKKLAVPRSLWESTTE